jgi:ring-1,2-phenylacetyl-CoA epoxidase subunit PaaC
MTDPKIHEARLDYLLRLADNNLILGQRLAEWCGHGPVLEQDIAITNMSLDLIGQARNLYQFAATLEGKGKTEDDLAYLRKEHEFRNVLLVEHENGDWAYTLARQFFYDVYNTLNYEMLLECGDDDLKGLAEKAIKECHYHLKFSAEWVIRLGDGTDLSHEKMQKAVDDLWMWTAELYTPNATDNLLLDYGFVPDLAILGSKWNEKVNNVLDRATLKRPQETWFQSGGKDGVHTEQMGYILAELQSVQRTYPGLAW